MHTNTDIDAVIRKAKQQRADYIVSKLQASALPIALVAIISLVLVSLAVEPSQGQVRHQPVVEVSAYNG